MLYFVTLELWGTKKEELIKFYRLMGADFIRNFNRWLMEYPALTREEVIFYSVDHDTEFRGFVKKEHSFPRNTSNLEQLLTYDTDMPAFVNLLTEIHQYYIVSGHEDSGFTRVDAEACVFHAIQHRHDSYVGHGRGNRNNLSAIVAQNPALLPWLSDIAKQHGRVVVSGDHLSEGGASDYYVMMPQSDFRAAQRRIRAEKGEDIDYNSCSDDDFSIGAVQDGIMYIKYHYDVMHHNEPFEAGGRNTDYAKQMEHGYGSFHYTDAFHAIYATQHYDRDVSYSQDLIEFMCYVDRERIIQRRGLGSGDNAPASMEIMLYAVLRVKTEDMARMLSGTSPKILADIIHYAAVGYRNPQIAEQYLLKDQPQAKAIMRKLLAAQSEVRRAAINKHLSAEAREFIATKAEPYDAKKAERERREALIKGLKDSGKVSSPVAVDDKKGGIDFRALPIVTQAMSNLKLMLSGSPVNRLPGYLATDLAKEWREIERIASSGITPSSERIKEYLQTSCAKGSILQDKDKVILCIAGILRSEEETCSATDPTLHDILVVLESGSSIQELKAVFIGT